MNLIVDAGNTRVKLAVFEKDTLVEVIFIDVNELLSEIKKILKKYKITAGILSNVGFIAEYKMQKLQNLVNLLVLSSFTNVPFNNLYETVETLGVDRIALVAAAVKKYAKRNILIIDAGTCITFDFVNDQSEYLGGAISPGIEMRYKALHDFTSKLPLLEKKIAQNFIGMNTNESINSGVVNGVINELEGVISQYKNKYSDLTVVLTGGDTNFLAKQLKSSIFANQNFLLEGLNEILIFNKNK
ncbi:type III pantothenate kinase [Polaribacter sp. Hel1_33_78]|jgi:type III pantothenate kinase|uniref:type III pantothenate kinase n=1 Tax=Polaribacter sp. Hel1_33_78 TaxID=1336804 RepID=UPI00087B76BA|nr:type III pantothenate kinase [Polaribacter sp. Hel1_33_78]MBT4413856.1 type III pantothenate kinase [Polaribacter sp.]MBT7815336.1 type III pantothenate kinase [Polaribacter sp.]SDT93496.1 type III pantothenate kinase [Polaribacter sp. Hel1_33_78]